MSLHELPPLTSHESHTCRVRHEAGFPGDRREARVRRCRSCDRGGVGIEAQAFAGVEPAGHGIAVRCSYSWSCPDHAGRPGFGEIGSGTFRCIGDRNLPKGQRGMWSTDGVGRMPRTGEVGSSPNPDL